MSGSEEPFPLHGDGSLHDSAEYRDFVPPVNVGKKGGCFWASGCGRLEVGALRLGLTHAGANAGGIAMRAACHALDTDIQRPRSYDLGYGEVPRAYDLGYNRVSGNECKWPGASRLRVASLEARATWGEPVTTVTGNAMALVALAG